MSDLLSFASKIGARIGIVMQLETWLDLGAWWGWQSGNTVTRTRSLTRRVLAVLLVIVPRSRESIQSGRAVPQSRSRKNLFPSSEERDEIHFDALPPLASPSFIFPFHPFLLFLPPLLPHTRLLHTMIPSRSTLLPSTTFASTCNLAN